jgi:AcrR family transcriptional regulator
MKNPCIRQNQTSRRRRDILDASLRCFLRHGIEATTIEHIREASGASSGSIYHHFGSKQTLAVELYVEGLEELRSLYLQAMAKHTSLRTGVRAILRSYFDWIDKNRDWALYLLRVATADLSADQAVVIDEINRRTSEDLAGWLRPFRERGEIAAMPDELYASIVFGMSSHFVRHWLVGRLKLDLATAFKHLSDAVFAGLTGAGSVRQTAARKSVTRARRIDPQRRAKKI